MKYETLVFSKKKIILKLILGPSITVITPWPTNNKILAKLYFYLNIPLNSHLCSFSHI